MVQQAEELANLLDVLSSISEAHAVEAENQSHKLSCDPPHMHQVCMPVSARNSWV